MRVEAKVAELADAPDLGSGSRKAMGVRLPPFAPAFAHAAGVRELRLASQSKAIAASKRWTITEPTRASIGSPQISR